MKKAVCLIFVAATVAVPADTIAQVDLSRATYIAVEQWRDTVNALPGVDRQIVSQDIEIAAVPRHVDPP